MELDVVHVAHAREELGGEGLVAERGVVDVVVVETPGDALVGLEIERHDTWYSASAVRMDDSNRCSIHSTGMDPDLTPAGIERLRRSIAMLAPRHASAMNRETALTVLEELQRLQAQLRETPERRFTDSA
jgi:hypothetical protein